MKQNTNTNTNTEYEYEGRGEGGETGTICHEGRNSKASKGDDDDR